MHCDLCGCQIVLGVCTGCGAGGIEIPPPQHWNLSQESIDAISKQVIEGLLAASKERKARKTRRAKAEAYPPEFEECWKLILKMSRPGNNKGLTYRAWKQRIIDGEPFDLLYQKTEEYLKFCEATGKIGKEIILLGATFFGPDKRYLDERQIPKEALTPKWVKMPKANDDSLKRWAAENEFSKCRAGESWFDYRRRLENEVEARLAAS